MDYSIARKIIRDYRNTAYKDMTKPEIANLITAITTFGFHHKKHFRIVEFTDDEIRQTSKKDLIWIANVNFQPIMFMDDEINSDKIYIMEE